MATQENNVVMRNASGMFGGQVVFRLRAGKTILAAPPTVNPDREVSADEEAARESFKVAIRHAKALINSPLIKAAYLAIAKPGQSAFNVAFTDVYYAPEILGLGTGNYNGTIGDIIEVEAVDNVKVTAVKVRINNAADQLIEQGDAVVSIDGTTWKYTVTAANANLAGTKIIATALDLAGNEGEAEAAL